jgi:hypothetical protein
MRAALLLAATLAMAGCGTAPKTLTASVPVAVGCLGPKPARPVTTFGVGPYPGDKAAAQAALGEAAAWEGYATGLEVAMSGCNPKQAPAQSKKP